MEPRTSICLGFLLLALRSVQQVFVARSGHATDLTDFAVGVWRNGRDGWSQLAR